jgi:hypothetical protein
MDLISSEKGKKIIFEDGFKVRFNKMLLINNKKDKTNRSKLIL